MAKDVVMEAKIASMEPWRRTALKKAAWEIRRAQLEDSLDALFYYVTEGSPPYAYFGAPELDVSKVGIASDRIVRRSPFKNNADMTRVVRRFFDLAMERGAKRIRILLPAGHPNQEDPWLEMQSDVVVTEGELDEGTSG